MKFYYLFLVLLIGCVHHQQVELEEPVPIEVIELFEMNIPQIKTEVPPPVEPTEPEQEPEPEYDERPVPDNQWNDTSKLWLARSMIGEVGWRRPAEQSAVAWIYAVRAPESSTYDFLGMVKRYSAAVRTPGKRRNPWLFELGFNRTRPKAWPTGPLWTGLHDDAWIEALELADRWQNGEVPNPCPQANHFGGYVDRHRAEAARWTRVKCRPPEGSKRFRNIFYDSTRLRPKRRINSRS